MSTYQARVEDLIGTVSDTTGLSDWLTSGAKIIVDKIPLEKAERFSTTVTDAGSGISIAGYRLIRAHKSNYRANLIDAGLAAQAADSASIHYATTTDPSAYVTGAKLYVLPSGGTGVVLPYPTVTYSASTITNFPTELDEAVVLYAAIRGIHQAINVLMTTSMDAVTITLPTAPTAPSIPASYTYTDATATGITTITVSLAGLTAPNYTKVTTLLDIGTNQAKPTAPDFTGITAPTTPSAPSFTYNNATAETISATTIAASPTFTDYTDTLPGMPVFNIIRTAVPTAPAFTDIDTDIAHSNISNTTISNLLVGVTSLIDLTTQLDTELATMLDTNFDIEAANAKLSEVQTRIQEFQVESSVAIQQAIENARNELQKSTENVRNANDINKFNAVQTLTANVQNYQLLLSKYSAQLSAWQSDINAQYQQHQLNLNAWEREIQSQLFSSLNTFNSYNAEYQAELNKVIEQARITAQQAIAQAQLTTDTDVKNELQTTATQIQEYVETLNKYRSDIQNYSEKVNKIISEYRALVEAWNIDRLTILQEQNVKIQDELNDQNVVNEVYQAGVQVALKNADMAIAEAIREAELTTDVDKQNRIYQFQAIVENWRDKISTYAGQVNSYGAEISGVVQEFVNKIQQVVLKYEGLLKQQEVLGKLYQQELQLHLG